MAYIGTSPSNGVRRRFVYEATANQTSFSGNDESGITLTYVDSLYLDVYQNGVKLKAGDDYTATTGTTVVLAVGATADDVVEMVSFDVFSVNDSVSASAGGSFAGAIGMGSTLAVTGNADLNGDLDVDGTTNLDIVDIDGAVNMATTLLVTGVVTANGGAVFNEGSADVDFRVESNASANALFVDGGANRVSVGSGTPSNPLTVVTSTDGSGVSGDNVFAALIHNAEATNDASKGLLIKAGTTTADQAFDVQDHDGSNQYFRILGNGDVCISRTASLSNGRVSVDFSSAADNGFCINDTASGNGAAFINFHTGGTSRGAITNNNNSAVAYNTSSDYRLKENVSYSFDATTELKKLKPCKFNFIGGDLTVEGFLAHEVQAVVPQAITGTHNEVDDDDNPVYQGIDQSKLVPLLVKTILELEARITALEG